MADVLSLRPMLAPLLKTRSSGFVDLLRVAPMMMNELMDEWFENELLRSAISASGVHHLSLALILQVRDLTYCIKIFTQIVVFIIHYLLKEEL